MCPGELCKALLASKSDVNGICAFDHIAQVNNQRRALIRHSIEAGTCYIAVTEEKLIVGYAVFEYSFYQQGFVAMLYVHPDFRRREIGSLLMRHLESVCQTAKIFTSTNLSNLPMQSLRARSMSHDSMNAVKRNE